MSTVTVTTAAPTAALSRTSSPRTATSHLLYLSHSAPASPQPQPQPQPSLLPRSGREGVTYGNGTAHYRFLFPHATSVAVATVLAHRVLCPGGPLPAPFTIDATTLLSPQQGGLWTGSVCVPGGLHHVVLLVDGCPVLTPHLHIGHSHGLDQVNYIDVPPPSDARSCVNAARPSVEHGTVAHNYVASYTTETTEEILVYLPPSYHKAGSATRRYPVLYLLHDDRERAMNCTQLGKVNVIADNLIADGAMAEMIIVMMSGIHAGVDGAGLLFDVPQMCEDLTEDIIPYIDNHYRTKADRDNRAIAGLSMGSMQTSRLCMTRHDLFAYAGVFSGFLRARWSGIGTADDDHIDVLRRDPAAFQAAMRVFFRCMGDDDTFRAVFEEDDALLADLGVACERRMYAGPHSWQVWRQAAADFLPLLFKGITSPCRR
ncbi:putative esterase [Novymonas esmeraldas]|uniref:Esterase n=1 Tax=Novymonas esmeraldas TaxID=1808958 RepID=A0AAW0EQM2_9TRYP